jgi:serine phosphatase RsbU (regulator of sigma subunit)/pSer/pThr/pTyr-binding forkhead associated (FHA) protein
MSEAKLRVHDAQGKRLIVLDRPLFKIGRHRMADLQLRPVDVSREHAEIAWDGEQYVLRDVGSSQGTYVNGRRVLTHSLADGDRIRLGQNDVEIVFEANTTSISELMDTTSDARNLGQMAAILNGLRALGSGRVLAEVLAVVLDAALDVTKAERGFIMLANERGELEFKTARGVGRATLPGSSFATSRQIPREVFSTDRAQVLTDLTEAAGGHDSTRAVGIRHVMCVPLRVASRLADASSESAHRVLGVLYLDGQARSRMRSSAVLSALEAFATQAALAIESARLYAEAAEKARVDRDLCLAAEIQRSLLGAPAFSGERVDLAAAAIPCRTIGGDFYDYLELADGSLAFALGDVAGKGPPAALLAAVVQSNFVAQASVGSDPGQTTARVNTAMLRRPIEARFATMFHGVLTSDGRLSYCNAGQEPAIVVGRDEVVWLEVGGPVLGLFTVDGYACETVQLKPDDLVIVYSDGVTEATNVGGDEFGRERLVESIAGGHGTKPEALLERVLDAVRTFSRDAPQADDITVLILRYRRSATELRS